MVKPILQLYPVVPADSEEERAACGRWAATSSATTRPSTA